MVLRRLAVYVTRFPDCSPTWRAVVVWLIIFLVSLVKTVHCLMASVEEVAYVEVSSLFLASGI